MMTTFAKQEVQALADGWNGPRSFCTCGHLGDGPESHHGDDLQPGHGACRRCDCQQFSWRRWTLQFGEALSKVLHPRTGAS
jgi:hypothetical protein